MIGRFGGVIVTGFGRFGSVVVVGGFAGRGKRKGFYGALLMATPRLLCASANSGLIRSAERGLIGR